MLQGGFRIESEGASDPGRVRKLNEDSYLIKPEVGLWVVADGMGGHDAGDFASQTLVAELEGISKAESAPALLTAIEDKVIVANKTLRETAENRGPGTVLG
ncbi:MAG: PP2C family protein-serine/threonine phosphatase [Paracoccaceae bacterium]